MFAVYRMRVGERIAYARGLLKGGFDFSGNERYEYDREHAPWAASGAALDTLWKQSVKNDWLRLKLAGKKPEEIRKTLDKRYANVLDGVGEIKGEDVFQSFLNAYAASIDPHTDYMTPRSAENFNMQISNSLEGIGAVLFKQDDVILIREIVPGGPAARSGKLKPGERLPSVRELARDLGVNQNTILRVYERLSGDGRACASCHPDGRDDGLVWSTPNGPRQKSPCRNWY